MLNHVHLLWKFKKVRKKVRPINALGPNAMDVLLPVKICISIPPRADITHRHDMPQTKSFYQSCLHPQTQTYVMFYVLKQSILCQNYVLTKKSCYNCNRFSNIL